MEADSESQRFLHNGWNRWYERLLPRQVPAGYLGLTINRLHNWHRVVPEIPKPISQERRVSFVKSDENIVKIG